MKFPILSRLIGLVLLLNVTGWTATDQIPELEAAYSTFSQIVRSIPQHGLNLEKKEAILHARQMFLHSGAPAANFLVSELSSTSRLLPTNNSSTDQRGRAGRLLLEIDGSFLLAELYPAADVQTQKQILKLIAKFANEAEDPQSASYLSYALLGIGGDGIDTLIALAQDGNQNMSCAALKAIQSVAASSEDRNIRQIPPCNAEWGDKVKALNQFSTWWRNIGIRDYRAHLDSPYAQMEREVNQPRK